MTSYDWALVIYISLFGASVFLTLLTPGLALRLERRFAPKSAKRMDKMYGENHTRVFRVGGLLLLPFLIHGIILWVNR